MNNERQHKILMVLEQDGEVQLQKLKEKFPNVSMMTLRRDLISLEQDGYMVRTYGGAVATKKLAGGIGEEDAYSRRAAEQNEAKLTIAHKALKLIEEGRSIYFDAGSTIMQLAKLLDDGNFSIVTSGANIALELVKKQHTSVVILGGLVNKNTLSSSGPNAILQLDTVNIDVAFMSASGFSSDSGFTVSNVYECELKRKVVKRAKKIIILMDSSKINKNLPYTYCTMDDVDIWVCEKELPGDLEIEAKKFHVEII